MSDKKDVIEILKRLSDRYEDFITRDTCWLAIHEIERLREENESLHAQLTSYEE